MHFLIIDPLSFPIFTFQKKLKDFNYTLIISVICCSIILNKNQDNIVIKITLYGEKIHKTVKKYYK